MAYKIVGSQCTGCSACEPECPNQAIYEKNGVFYIKPEKCTECIGHFDEAQCVGNLLQQKPVQILRISRSALLLELVASAR